MPEDLRERVMQDVSTVEWPDGRTIRQRAGRRRARRVVVGCAAAVAVLAVVWTVLPPVGGDGSNRPADLAGPAPGTLRGEDMGPGWRVDSWGHVESTEERPDQGVQVTTWPPVEIAGCPAYRTAAHGLIHYHCDHHDARGHEDRARRPAGPGCHRIRSWSTAGVCGPTW